MYRAVCFDLGGVVFDSPFDALADLESERGLRPGSINEAIVVAGPDGAWARNERGEMDHDEFLRAFDLDLRRAGIPIPAAEVMERIRRQLRPRPALLEAIDAIAAAGLRTAAITNNWRDADGSTTGDAIRDRFDVFVESAVEGVHKPDPAIFRIALDRLEVAAEEAVFLDDIGRNLKAAQSLGMTTIKVETVEQALVDLGEVLGLDLVT